MTSSDAARLAQRVRPNRLNRLVLFHVSDRYTSQEWHEQRKEVRRRFDREAFPDEQAIRMEST